MAEHPTIVREWLTDCVCAELETAGRPVCDCFAIVGEPILDLDACCECLPGRVGQLTVSLLEVYDADPQTLKPVDTRVRPCRGGVTVGRWQISLSRCYPTVDERGNPPAPEALNEAADGLDEDITAVWTAVTCCWAQRVGRSAIAGMYSNTSPEGGCSVLSMIVVAETSMVPAYKQTP